VAQFRNALWVLFRPGYRFKGKVFAFARLQNAVPVLSNLVVARFCTSTMRSVLGGIHINAGFHQHNPGVFVTRI